jgi:hypothetical protein
MPWIPCGPAGPFNTISNSGPLPVSKLSLESKEKIPFVVVSANATPLLTIVPLTQPCTSAVMSMRKNLFKLAVVIAMGLYPVAEGPSNGGGVL